MSWIAFRRSYLWWALLWAPTFLFGVIPIALFLAPIVQSIRANGGFSTSFAGHTLGVTLLLCTIVAMSSASIGVAAGMLLGSGRWKGQSVARLMVLVPLVLPPYFLAVGWTEICRPNGPVAMLLQVFGLSPTLPTQLLYSFLGSVFVLSLAYAPIYALLVDRVFSMLPLSLIELAQIDGASRWQLFRHVLWAHIRPVIVVAAALVFVMTASELGVPTLFKTSVLSVDILTQLAAFNDVNAASALILPVFMLSVIIALIEPGIRRTGWQETSAGVEVLAMRRLTRRKQSVRILFFGALIGVSTLAPLGSLISQGTDGHVLTYMGRMAMRPAMKSIEYAAIASSLAIVWAWALAATTEQASPLTRRVIDVLLLLLFAAPSSILALAILAAQDRGLFFDWMAGSRLLIAALFLRLQFLAYRGVQQTRLLVPNALREAAAIDGATGWQATRYVTAPLLAAPLLAIGMLAFILAAGDLGSTILLYPPGGETLLVVLFSIEANSPRSYVAALTLLNIALGLAPYGLLLVVMRVINLTRASRNQEIGDFRG